MKVGRVQTQHLISACGPFRGIGHQPASYRPLGSGRVSPTVPTSCPAALHLLPNEGAMYSWAIPFSSFIGGSRLGLA